MDKPSWIFFIYIDFCWWYFYFCSRKSPLKLYSEYKEPNYQDNHDTNYGNYHGGNDDVINSPTGFFFPTRQPLITYCLRKHFSSYAGSYWVVQKLPEIYTANHATFLILWCVAYQNMVNRVCGVHFWRNFWKIFKNEDFGFNFFEKGHILMLFSGLAP